MQSVLVEGLHLDHRNGTVVGKEMKEGEEEEEKPDQSVMVCVCVCVCACVCVRVPWT